MPGKKKDQVKTLTPQQEAAINLLATGSTHEQAAQALNISHSTIYKWMRRNPTFRAKLKKLTGDLGSKI
jgi:DNA-binding NarL/FixJ family response regulator